MGNIGGIQRRGALDLEKVVFPVVQEVVEEFFPSLLRVELRDGGIAFDWVHPQDRREMHDTAMMWWQETRAKVGGKHLRGCGDLGYWIMAVIQHHTAHRIKGEVKLFDEGVEGSWDADPLKYPDLWTYLYRGSLRNTWERTVFSCRLKVELLYEYLPQGLDRTVLSSIPDWAREPREAELPPVEDWYPPLQKHRFV